LSGSLYGSKCIPLFLPPPFRFLPGPRYIIAESSTLPYSVSFYDGKIGESANLKLPKSSSSLNSWNCTFFDYFGSSIIGFGSILIGF